VDPGESRGVTRRSARASKWRVALRSTRPTVLLHLSQESRQNRVGQLAAVAPRRSSSSFRKPASISGN